MPNEKHIEYIALPINGTRRLLVDAFSGTGMVDEEASLVADALVDAELCDVPTHGFLRVPPYLDGLRSGRFNPRPDIRVVHESQVAALVDADNALGYLPAWRAMQEAVNRARVLGVGLAGVRHSNEFGRAAYYVSSAAAEGFVAIACTNTRPMLSGPGGTSATHGNNPIAFSVPGVDAPVFDAAFTPRSGGELLRRRLLGLDVPRDWGYRDAAGDVTTDPWAASQSLMPAVGGAKGFGLAILADLLAGVLTGSQSGPSVPLDNSGVGAFFIVLDPNIFGAAAALEPAMRNAARAARSTGARWPGDRARAARAVGLRRGHIAVATPIFGLAIEAMERVSEQLGTRARDLVSG